MTPASQLKALHMVSAWSNQHRLVLGQTKVNAKSNEITAIPALLEMLDISGCIITIDAMGTPQIYCPKNYTSHTAPRSEELV